MYLRTTFICWQYKCYTYLYNNLYPEERHDYILIGQTFVVFFFHLTKFEKHSEILLFQLKPLEH